MTRLNEDEYRKLLVNNPDLVPVDDIHPVFTALTPQAQVGGPFWKEHDFQRALVAECDRRAERDPVWGLLYAVPNGQYRQGSRPEAGMRKGVPDLCLPVARHGYHGMYLELKVGKNRTSAEQKWWLAQLQEQGYYCVVLYDSVDKAVAALEWYLEG